jgi:hypothetical protein
MNFYELGVQVHKERIQRQQHEQSTIDYKTRVLYSDFWLWCIAFEKDKNDYKNFKLYLIDMKKDVNFWIIKKFLENYFDFEFIYNYTEQKWIVKNLTKDVF